MKIDLPPLSERPQWVHPVLAPLTHKHFVATVKRLNLLIDMYPIVPFIGPTGVGKTAVVDHLIAHYNEEVVDQPQFLRAAMVDATTRRERAYSFKELWRNVLRAVEDPLPERKIVRSDPSSGRRDARLKRPRNASQDELFGAVRRAAVDRRLRVLFVDEAAALFLHCSRDHLERTLYILRDLTKGLDLTVVLVATGRLLAALRGLPDSVVSVDPRSVPDDVPSSAEFGRRRNFLHFRHYHADVLAEHKFYGSAVRTLFDRLPSELRPKLRAAHNRELIDRTSGCIGETIEWLIRAVKFSRHHGDAPLRWEHFAATALSDSDRDAVRAQSEQGERLFEEFTGKIFDPRIESPDPAPAVATDSDSQPAPSFTVPVKSKTRSGARVGKPKAKSPDPAPAVATDSDSQPAPSFTVPVKSKTRSGARVGKPKAKRHKLD